LPPNLSSKYRAICRAFQVLIYLGKPSLKKKRKAIPAILYVVGIAATSWSAWIAQAIYVFVALLWLVPDKRIEKVFYEKG
jgi:hypothetical protein